jgi:hypothetical protein
MLPSCPVLSITTLSVLLMLLFVMHSATGGVDRKVALDVAGTVKINSLCGKYSRCGLRLESDSIYDPTQVSSA